MTGRHRPPSAERHGDRRGKRRQIISGPSPGHRRAHVNQPKAEIACIPAGRRWENSSFSLPTAIAILRFAALRPARFTAMPSILMNVLLQTLHSVAFAAIVIAG